MQPENLNIQECMESRRLAITDSLRTISVAEVNALTDELFPHANHPWREEFITVINDPTSGTLHHAMADERMHILYCHNKNIGLWFIPTGGMGPLQSSHLGIMKGIIEADHE